MKTNHTYYKQFISLFILFLFNTNIYSQTMDLIDVKYQNIQIPHCSSIDLNLGTEHYITFKVRFEKPHYGTNADLTDIAGDVFVKLGARGTTVNLASNHINTNSWTVNGNIQYFELTGSVSISNSQLDTQGGVIFILYTSNNNNHYTSCEYSITRPEYFLNPSNTSVSCGSTGVTFNVSDTNNSPGTIQYNWSVGSGWKRNGVIVSNFTTSNSNITLVPYLYPPSNVNVTPVLNGVSYPQQTSTVSLSGFNPNNTIIGPSSICTTGNYDVLGSLPSNGSVTWSLLNTNIASLTQTGNSATITVNAGQDGQITVSAAIINSCGQSKVFSKQIFVGSPVVNNSQVYGGWDNTPVNSHAQLHVDWAQGNTGYLWTITTLNSSGSGTTPQFSATNSNTATGRYVTVNWGSRRGTYVVNCKAINSCSQTGIGHKVVTVFDQSNNPCPPYNPSNKGVNIVKIPKNMEFSIKVYPNPVKGDIIYVNKLAPFSSLNPCNNYSGKISPIKEIKNTVAIYDFFGNLVYTKTFDTDLFKIKNTKLKKGTYFLRVTDSYGITKKTTLKVN